MGKGGRCPETRMGRYARCEAPKPSWGSSACGGTLESWVLRKAHARFGEGRMEKCSRSNSPAAYSTSWSVSSTRPMPGVSGTRCALGPGFSTSVGVLAILIGGVVLQSAFGPAEDLLNMLG